MGQVLGDLLPLALGVAISPIPIIAVILMLLAARAGAASVGFAIGWVLGIVLVSSATALLAGAADVGGSDGLSTAAAWVQLVLGVLLLLVAVRQWRGRPRGDAPPRLPKWMTALDGVSAPKAAGLGVLLSALNPKNLLLCVSAGVTVAGDDLTGGEQVVAVAVFTALAASTVVVPAVAYAVAAQRMQRPLEALKAWLQQNNAVVMAVLLLVIGVTLVGKGIGGLT